MAISYIGAGTVVATNGGAPTACGAHASTATGDLVVWYHYSRATGATHSVTIPTGFTTVFNSVTAGSGLVAVAWRYRQAGDTTYTATIANHVSSNSGDTVLEWCETYRDTHPTTPVGSFTSTLSTWASSLNVGPVNPPSTAALADGDWVVIFGGRFENVTGQSATTGHSLTWTARTTADSALGLDAGAITQTGANGTGAPQTLTAKTVTTTGTTQVGAGRMFTLMAAPPVAITQAGYRFYADGTETSSTALANQNTAPAADISSGDVNLQLRMLLQATSGGGIAGGDDFQLQWEKNASGTWKDVTSVGIALLDSYDSANVSGSGVLDTATDRRAQSFLGDGGKLARASFWLNKTGTPGGNVTATLYGHTGTYGAGGTPLLTVLAAATTSPSQSTISTTAGWVDFDFSPTFTLANGTAYTIAIRTVGGFASPNCLAVGLDTTSPTHAGNAASYTASTWTGAASTDLIFRVYIDDPVTTAVPYGSASLTDGAATTNRLTGGTGSFTAGEVSEDGLVDDLTWASPNFTELLYSLTLKQADLTGGDTLRFRVLRNGATTGLTYTQTPTVTIATVGPSVTAFETSDWTTTTTPRTISVTGALTGDKIVVLYGGDNGTGGTNVSAATVSTTGGSTGAWTEPEEGLAAGSQAWLSAATADVTGDGTVTVSLARTQSSGKLWGGWAALCRNAGGIGVHTRVAPSATETASLAVEQDSAVLLLAVDWEALATVAFTPSGAFEVQRAQAGGGPDLTDYAAYWLDQAAGTRGYGIATSSTTNLHIVAVEVLKAGGTTAVGKDLQAVWDTRSPMGDTIQVVWNVQVPVTAVGKDLQAVWHVRSALGDTVQAIWDTRAALGDTLQTIWNTRSAVADTVQVLWGIRTPVADTLQAIWDIRIPLGDQLQAVWHIRAVIGDPLQAVWNTNAATTPLGKDLQSVWNVRISASDTIQALWDIRTPAADTAALVWDTRAAVADTLQAIWNVEVTAPPGLVGKDLQALWNTRAALSDTLQTIWDVRTTATDQIQTIWNVRSAAGDVIQLQWDTRAALGDVVALQWGIRTSTADTLALAWDVRTTAADTLQAVWHLKATLTDTLQVLWDVEAIGITAVGKNVQVLWNTRTILGDPLQLAWDARAAVSDGLQAVWDTRGSLGDPVALVWHTRAAIGDPLDLRWNVVGPAAKELQLTWDIRTRLGDPLDLRWGIRTPIGDTVQTLWAIRTPAGDQVDLRWNVIGPAFKDLQAVWNTRARLPVLADLRWGIRTPAGDTITIRWNLKSAIGDPLQLRWSVQTLDFIPRPDGGVVPRPFAGVVERL